MPTTSASLSPLQATPPLPATRVCLAWPPIREFVHAGLRINEELDLAHSVGLGRLAGPEARRLFDGHEGLAVARLRSGGVVGIVYDQDRVDGRGGDRRSAARHVGGSLIDHLDRAPADAEAGRVDVRARVHLEQAGHGMSAGGGRLGARRSKAGQHGDDSGRGREGTRDHRGPPGSCLSSHDPEPARGGLPKPCENPALERATGRDARGGSVLRTARTAGSWCRRAPKWCKSDSRAGA